MCFAQESINLKKDSPNCEKSLFYLLKQCAKFMQVSEMHLSYSMVLDKCFVLLAYVSLRVKLE